MRTAEDVTAEAAAEANDVVVQFHSSVVVVVVRSPDEMWSSFQWK
jgi:hypothetical protein